MAKILRIATRKSALALWQTNFVAQRLKKHHPSLSIELVPLSTKGDQILDSPLAKIGGKGLFVKELEQAMLDNKADIAVHSMKDVPVELPPNLMISAYGQRECPWDALVGPHQSILDLPANAQVGTSSLRRQVQLKAARSDLNVTSLRGNVNTRLAKLDEGAYDAIVLASAGLIRLDFEQRIACNLSLEQDWLPALCQGVIGIECRTDDTATRALIQCFNDTPSQLTTLAERSLNKKLEGGCQVPIGGFAQWTGDKQIQMDAFVSNGEKMIIRVREELEIDPSEPIESQAAQMTTFGAQVAEKLNQMGAQRLLAQARATFGEPNNNSVF